MRFLVDECTGPAVAEWLRREGHKVFSVYDEARGLDDETIIQKAFTENWILITNDKDFGGGRWALESERLYCFRTSVADVGDWVGDA